uniref:Uncharacterized protein n=1 Tax=Salix viminalis TaxID=40686 RepID=A0A6N2N5T3_SALVM
MRPDTITGWDVAVLQLNEHSKFERKLDDLLVRCTISLTEALCGYDQISLPFLVLMVGSFLPDQILVSAEQLMMKECPTSSQNLREGQALYPF